MNLKHKVNTQYYEWVKLVTHLSHFKNLKIINMVKLHILIGSVYPDFGPRLVDDEINFKISQSYLRLWRSDSDSEFLKQILIRGP